MSKTKLMNDASVQRVTTAVATDLVNIVDNTTGKVKAIEYDALLTQLRNDLLDGKSVGVKPNQIVSVISCPAPATLVSSGYLEQSVMNVDKPYFEAVLKKFADDYPQGGTFFLKTLPNSQGVGILYLYDAGKAENGLPMYCAGLNVHINNGIINKFSTIKGVLYFGTVEAH